VPEDAGVKCVRPSRHGGSMCRPRIAYRGRCRPAGLPYFACLALLAASSTAASLIGGDLRLIEAVKSGNREAVRALIARHTPVNAPEADGTTALHWAARANDTQMARILLRAGAAAGAANRYGMTPLMLAGMSGSAPMIDLLLEAGADPNTALPDGQTVVMAAARTGSLAAVEELLARGADPNAREGRLGETALMWAAAENHAPVILALASAGADVNARSRPSDFPRYSFGDGIVALMMTLPRGSWTPLMYAARQGAVDAVRALLDAGADPDLADPEGSTPLLLAIDNAHYDVALLLIEAGASPDASDVTGTTPLYAAVNMHTLGDLPGRPAPRSRGEATAVDVATALLTHGADPNRRLATPILQRHHSAGDSTLGEGATPLLRAAKTGDVPMMRLLLEHGADASLTTKNGTTAVMFAVGPVAGGLGGGYPVSDAEKIAAMDLALAHGVDINASDVNGQTALHVAAGQASAGVVEAVVQRGASLDRKDNQGRTPIEIARGAGGRGGRPVRSDIVDLLERLASHRP